MKTIAILITLLLLPLLATQSQAAPTRPCQDLEQVRKDHKTEHLRYRLVDGHKCWFAGEKVAKSEFIVPKTTATPVARVPAERLAGPVPVPNMDQRGLTLTPEERTQWQAHMVDDAFVAICGGLCNFNSRWQLK